MCVLIGLYNLEFTRFKAILNSLSIVQTYIHNSELPAFALTMTFIIFWLNRYQGIMHCLLLYLSHARGKKCKACKNYSYADLDILQCRDLLYALLSNNK